VRFEQDEIWRNGEEFCSEVQRRFHAFSSVSVGNTIRTEKMHRPQAPRWSSHDSSRSVTFVAT
jgi:hypothetical protein